MPGVFGIVDRGAAADVPGYLARAGLRLAHRPWYVANTWLAASGAVGLGRSTIGILNREPQPVTSSSGLTLVFCGEFYRTKALRERLDASRLEVPAGATHADLALTAISALGPAAARLMDGAFVIAVFDDRRRTLTLINDRFGQYPTYYAVGRGALAFAPEVAAVLCAPFVPRTLDLTAVAEYVRFQHLLDTRTFHEGVSQFPHGSIGQFDVDTGAWSVERYWDWDDIPERPDLSFAESVEEGAARLRDAVRVRSSDALRPGVFLSGGLDSRSIVGFLAEQHPAPLTATFGVRGCRDVHYAERVARATGSRHRWFDLPDGRWVLGQLDLHFRLTEGFHSWVHMHGMTMLPELRELIDYNLCGWDGGTVMGHPDSVNAVYNQPPDHAALLVHIYDGLTRSYTWPGLTEGEERLLYSPKYRGELVGLAFESTATAFAPYERFRLDNRAEYFYIRNHCFRLAQNMVTFTRSHIEVRCPFWDYPLVELMYAVPSALRQKRRLYREIMTRELRRLAMIPYDKQETLPTTWRPVHDVHAVAVALGHRLRLRPRRATLYADYENYLRTDLRPWAETILFDPRARYREYIDQSFVRSLMERHMSGSEMWTIGKIASLVTLEMVLATYFD